LARALLTTDSFAGASNLRQLRDMPAQANSWHCLQYLKVT
jgi:hypothetical protein